MNCDHIFFLFVFLLVFFVVVVDTVCLSISECPSVLLFPRPQLDLDQILPLPRSLDRKQIKHTQLVFFFFLNTYLNNLMAYMFTFCLLYWSNKLLMQPGCKSVFMLKSPTPVFTGVFFYLFCTKIDHSGFSFPANFGKEQVSINNCAISPIL